MLQTALRRSIRNEKWKIRITSLFQMREREKVKLEVKKCRLEINKLQMDAKLTQLMYVKETLLVRKLESEMGVLPMVIEPLRDLVNGSADSE